MSNGSYNSAKSHLIDSQELFDVLIDSTKYNGAKYLQMLPLSDEIKPFFISNSNITSGGNDNEIIEFNKILTYDNEEQGLTEVIILKESIIQTFLNSFKLFKEKYINDDDNDDDNDTVFNNEKYLISLIILIITPEDHKFLNIHLKQFKLIYGENSNFLKFEINLIISLLTSNLPKTNKSSSLWELLKKLTILKFQELNELQDIIKFINILISCVFKSCKLHNRNYYGWSFMKFLINLIKLIEFNNNNNDDNEIIINNLISKFNDKINDFLNDFSFFNTYSNLLFNDLNELTYTYNNILRFSEKINNKISLNNINELNFNFIFEQLIKLYNINNNLNLNSYSILFNFSIMLIKLNELTNNENENENEKINEFLINYFNDLKIKINKFKLNYKINEFKLINNELNIIINNSVKNINEFNYDLNFKNQLKLIEINLKILNFYNIYNNSNNNN